jgi:hypothetical protein
MPGVEVEVPPEEHGHDPQMRRRRDRQELGEPLDDAEDDGLQQSHARGPVTGATIASTVPQAAELRRNRPGTVTA